MSCVVYQTNKKTGITYAYESVSYWDKEKKQPRSKRKYLGRVDPETKEIVKKEKPADAGDPALRQKIAELEKELDGTRSRLMSLQEDLSSLQKKYRKAQEVLQRVHTLTSLENQEK